MSSLDDHHLSEDGEFCWCNPELEPIQGIDSLWRTLIIHNKVEIQLKPDLTTEEVRRTLVVCEDMMTTVDQNLARWWAVHEYAKLGS